MKQKIVVDTNVLVSSLIAKSYPAFIIDEFVISRKVTLLLTDDIWNEYIDVLNRPKFARFANFKINADLVLLRFDEIAEKLLVTERLAVLADEADNRFLEAALAGSADYVITGNTTDFTMPVLGNTRIVTPATYWEDCRPVD
ncbi:putative toxin-antitoxin system toxin component, PIN family [Fibrella aquatica]|uniref:putative toxin-antitoxin system toxin component, PIN family n=1 Tax=Fibrella aquatica TaxID=3242487 RepID=UPI0035224A80